MSERWHQSGFSVNDESQYPHDANPHTTGPVPCSNPQPYDYYGSSYYPVGGAMPFRQAGQSNSHSGNADGFPQAGHCTDHLAVATGFGYSLNPSDGSSTTSYGLVRHSQMEYYEHANPSTGSSSHYPQPDPNHPTPQSFRSTTYSGNSPHAPQYHDATGPSHIPAGTAWASSDSGYRYDATYPLSTNSSTESVPDPTGQSCVFKQVVATSSVVDASVRRRHPVARSGRLYSCTDFPPCQATFTSSHNLKSNVPTMRPTKLAEADLQII
ncbi:hypothetical protein WG66_014887 [Moniliophthora roreri]|nr:hypothetical protein WG66_014887 [Moniliophthora roreri]